MYWRFTNYYFIRCLEINDVLLRKGTPIWNLNKCSIKLVPRVEIFTPKSTSTSAGNTELCLAQVGSVLKKHEWDGPSAKRKKREERDGASTKSGSYGSLKCALHEANMLLSLERFAKIHSNRTSFRLPCERMVGKSVSVLQMISKCAINVVAIAV